MRFVLDPKLESDSDWICDLPLSQVRLSHNAAFPWIILIPKRADLVELIDLSESDTVQLFKEIRQGSKIMQTLFHPKKLNVAALGNIVAQLHIHVIARFESDKAWPNPVWNSGIQAHYSDDEKEKRIRLLAEALRK